MERLWQRETWNSTKYVICYRLGNTLQTVRQKKKKAIHWRQQLHTATHCEHVHRQL